MKSAAFKVVILLIAGLAFSGCRMRAVYNVDSAVMATSPTATLADVTNAIIRAGATRGWNMKHLGPGRLEARNNVRGKHLAVVSITFNTRDFSITYKNSENLKYDGKQIHANYFSWVRDLETEILKETGEL